MKRQIVYPGQVPLETDLLNTNKNAMISIGHVLQDMLGTSTLFSGLACAPTSPAGMTVNVAPGRAYSLQQTDTAPYSSLAADTHNIVKQGIILDTTNFSCPAPTTSGFSINYLVQGAFQEADGGATVLPYYNASNPSQAYNGPGGNNQSQSTYRDDTVQLQLKAGVGATTGSQVTPTPDAGFTGLWVITVAFGASTITSGNISQYPSAPILPSSLLQMITLAGANYAGVATGTANAQVISPQPAITTRVDGMVLRYKASAANTGALTVNDGVGTVAVVGAAHAALQGGETAPNGDVWIQWNTSIGGGSYVMLDSTGGALQVSPATQSGHAVQLGQLTAAKQPHLTRITTSGNFTTSANITTATVFEITLIGGGGGGGGSNGSQSVGASGGSGGAVTFLLSGLSPNTSYSVSIGASGSGGSTAGGNGSAGGTTSIVVNATTYSVTGGGAGPGSTTSTVNSIAAQGSASASITSLPFIFWAQSVSQGISTGALAIGPCGGSNPYGQGGTGGLSGTGAGSNGSGFGGGGGGAVSTAGAGGSGSSGGALIKWWE